MTEPEHPDLDDDHDILICELPQWAFWVGIFSVAGFAYWLLH